jgi:hypothetical protein
MSPRSQASTAALAQARRVVLPGRLGANPRRERPLLLANRGAQSVTRNRVNGNLQCKENVPAPTGGGNIVQGNKEDQCARL